MKIEVTKAERTMLVGALFDHARQCRLATFSEHADTLEQLAVKVGGAPKPEDDGPEVAILRTVRA